MTSPAVPDRPGAVWSRFPLDPRSSGDLRAGDPDRELARTILAEAYAEGQLDHEEYTKRVGDVLTVHHLGQLVPLLNDVSLVPAGGRRLPPPGPTGPNVPAVAGQARALSAHPVVRSALFVIAVTNLVWLWTSVSSGRALYYWPMWPALGMVILVLAAVLFRGDESQQVHRLERRAERRSERYDRRRRRRRGNPDQP